MATPNPNNNLATGNGMWSTQPGISVSPNLGSSTTGTTTGGVWGTSYVGSDLPKTKEWTKIKCHGCDKELGYVKDSYGWKVDAYYCEDCKLLEKLKE